MESSRLVTVKIGKRETKRASKMHARKKKEKSDSERTNDTYDFETVDRSNVHLDCIITTLMRKVAIDCFLVM